MSAEINYKQKYLELRSKYMNDLDMAFRLGFEQGGQQAQNDQVMQQEQQSHEVEMAAAQGMNGGAPGQGAPDATAAPEGPQEPQSEHPQGSEIDQHIAKLEQAIAKSENLSGDVEIKKSLEDLKSMRKTEVLNQQIKKNERAIKAISKALHKPAFKMSRQASINLNDNAKQAVSLQHKIVSDVMNKMEAEEKRASKDIEALLADLTKE